MAASLTEEELRELERLVRGYVEALGATRRDPRGTPSLFDAGAPLVQALERHGGEHAVLLYLIGKARAVRNASVAVEQAIAVLDSVPPHSFVRDSYYDNATSALLDARLALTAAAEPTAGEER